MMKKQTKNLIGTARTKRIFLTLGGGLFLGVLSFSVWQQLAPTEERGAAISRPASSEYAFFNTSPAGVDGGFAIPASCPSDIHDVPTYGQTCTSAPNNCGTTNTGTIQCNGTCSATKPADKANCTICPSPNNGKPCTTCNACGACNAGTYDCNGVCSAVAPAVTEYSRETLNCSAWDYFDEDRWANVCYGGTTDIVQFCPTAWKLWEYQNNGCGEITCVDSTCARPDLDGKSCIGPANACGQTRWGSYDCDGNCSAPIPSLPAGYGNTCNPTNACGQSNTGTINCTGSCSVPPPALPANLNQDCQSAPNSCGVRGDGKINCSGNCTGITPPDPIPPDTCFVCAPNMDAPCTSVPNVCGETNAGIILCDGTCSAFVPAPVANYDDVCTNMNSCGVSGSGGRIDCSGYCSDTPPPDPIPPITCTGCHVLWTSTCQSPANFCGQTASGTYDCEGNCTAVAAPPMPANYGSPCTVSNACGQSNTGTINCSGSCSVDAPPNPPNYGNPCQSGPNICGMIDYQAINCQSVCPAVTPADILCARHYICPSGVVFGFSSPIPYAQLRSYYKNTPFTCADLTGTTETTQVVNWSSSDPSVATVSNTIKGQVERIAIGTAWISVTPYNTVDASPVPVDVLCVPFINCSSAGPAAVLANTCPDTILSFDDGCGGIVWCTGTRTCDFNWREVSQ